MMMKPVTSSVIASVGYDEPTRTMRVLFKNTGGLYEYAGITPQQHGKLMSAKSIGAHFSKHHGRDGKKVTK